MNHDRQRSFAFVLVSVGGVTYERGGAHAVVNQFIEALPNLAERYEALRNAAIHVLGLDLRRSSPDFRPDLFGNVLRAVPQGNIRLLKREGRPFEGFDDIYGDPHDIAARKSIALGFAGDIIAIAREYERVFVFAHEEHAMWIPGLLDLLDNTISKKICVAWVPHNLSQMYPVPYPDRYEAELSALSAFRDRDLVVSVDEQVTQVLRERYDESCKIIECPNEVWPLAARYRGCSSGLLPAAPFIFSSGRMAPHKGLAHLLDLYESPDLFSELPMLVLAAPEQNEGRVYARMLESRIEDLNHSEERVRWIRSYEPQIVAEALKSRDLRGVILPSSSELRSILALEVRAMIGGMTQVFYSDLDSHLRIFADTSMAYAFRAGSSASLISVVKETFGSADRRRIPIDPIERYLGTYAELFVQTERWFAIE